MKANINVVVRCVMSDHDSLNIRKVKDMLLLSTKNRDTQDGDTARMISTFVFLEKQGVKELRKILKQYLKSLDA